MASKHYGWQKKWTVNQQAGSATHESGLIVRYVSGRIVADNAPQTIEALAVKNGHNAASMVARMQREALALFTGTRYADVGRTPSR